MDYVAREHDNLYYASLYAWELSLSIFYKIYRFSEVLFWVLVVSYGVMSIFAFIAWLTLGVRYTMELSQLVCISRKGARYIAMPIPFLLLGAFLLFCIKKEIITGASFTLIASIITMMIYCALLVVQGARSEVD